MFSDFDKRETIGAMQVGQVGYIYPSGIMLEAGTTNRWLNPSNPIYDAPGLGARIERTEIGYLVAVVYGNSPSVWHGANGPADAGFVIVNKYEEAAEF